MISWIKAMFHRRREPDADSEVARELAMRISRRADEISEHFKGYQRARDPFAAMMADMYNRDQLSRIYRGNRQ